MHIVVVGAGPAGLAAALSAASTGARVTVIDDNPAPGGQIWRGASNVWTRRFSASGAYVINGAMVISLRRGELILERGSTAYAVAFDKLILATGSRELFLPFPGWTLPGVVGAGGLQALVKSGFSVRGKRVAVAGTGPLLLAAAAHLRKKGAQLLVIAEQAPWPKLLRFGLTLPLRKQIEAAALWSPRYLPGTWVTSAQGANHVQQVTLSNGRRTWTLDCDYLATGYGLCPNTELAALLNCAPGEVDELQQTSTPGVFCAGEITGIGGVDLSRIEGTIAGLAAASRADEARKYFPARRRWRAFAGRLAAAFALRPELKNLATPETLVCRCEDVSLERLSRHSGWREAKIHTRCGMGPCQGRVCGPAVRFLLGWEPESVRPPVFPARVASFIMENRKTQ